MSASARSGTITSAPAASPPRTGNRLQASIQEESIYGLLPHKEEPVIRKARYVSKYKQQVVDEVQQKKKAAGALGPPPPHLLKQAAHTAKPGPTSSGPVPVQPVNKWRLTSAQRPQQQQLAIKGEGSDVGDGEDKDGDRHEDVESHDHPPHGHSHGGRQCMVEHRRPPVPKHTDRPVIKPPPNTDHIVTNAVNNIKSSAKKPPEKYVDTPGGSTFPLEESGLKPKYVKKKSYGKVPKYIEQKKQREENVKQEAAREYERIVAERQPYQELSEEDRQSVLDGLKKNWEELYHQYQSLSLVIDTIPKKNRKEMLEAQLNQLERDIDMLEKPQKIFIAKDGTFSA